MILLLWRLFVRYVVGYVPGLPECLRCTAPRSAICISLWCRRHCAAECRCEDRMSTDEVKLVAEYRAACERPALRAVRS